MACNLIRSGKVIFAGVALALLLAGSSFAGIPEFLPDYQSDSSIPVPPDAVAVQAKSKTAPFRIIVKVKSGKTTRDLSTFRAKNRKSTHRYKNTFSPRVNHQAQLNSLRNERARYGRAKSSDPRVLDLDRRTRIKEALVARMAKREQRARHGKKRKAPALEDIYIVEVPKTENVSTVLKEYQSDPNVEYAQPDYEMKAFAYPETLPNDTAVNPSYDGMTWRKNSWGQDYEDMWGLKIIKADKAWPLSQGNNVIVAVVDSGVDRHHPDLNGAMWVNSAEIPGNRIDDDNNGFVDDCLGWDFVGADVRVAATDNDPIDGLGHGTHVSGTIAARGNNGEGIIGVAPLATIMAVKGLDDSGKGTSISTANAVKYAVDNGAEVINCSWGGTPNRVVMDAIHYAESHGVVVVAAAGNSTADASDESPAGIDSVITVSASSQEDKICDFSNYGDKIDVSAPGGDSGYIVANSSARDYSKVNIVSLRAAGTDMYGAGGQTFYPLTAEMGAKYMRAMGTSMAAPHVSGVAALMLGVNPALNTDQVKSILQSTAVDVNNDGKDIYFGFGRVDARKACEEAQKSPIITSPQAFSYVRGIVDLVGTAALPEGFNGYEVFWAPGDHPEDRTRLGSFQSAVTNGRLASVNTAVMPEKQVILTVVLSVADKDREVSVRVNVDNVSQEPVFNVSNMAMVVGQPNRFVVTASDTDDPATPQGTLTYSAAGLPVGASLDSTTGALSWTPARSDCGTYSLVFTVRDDIHQVSKPVSLTTVTLDEIPVPAINTSTWIMKEGKIIWHETRDGFLHLISFDIASGKLEQLTSAKNNDLTPDLDNGRLVFARRNNVETNVPMWGSLTSADIFWRDPSGVERQITNYPTHQTWPKLSGDKVAWMDLRHSNQVEGQYDLYMYDFVKGIETPISENPFPQYLLGGPLSGDKLAWFDRRNGNYDIFLYDMKTQVQRQFTSNKSDDVLPQLFEDKIVWLRRSGMDGTSIMLAQGDGPERVLDQTSAVYSFPRFNDNKVVWADGRDGRNYHIFMNDLTRQSNFQLTLFDKKDHLYPAVSGSWVMWMDYEYVNGDFGPYTVRTCRLFKMSYPPFITAVEPAAASRCSTIAISGTGFGDREEEGSRVFLDGKPLPVLSWTDTRITVVLPADVSSGTVSLSGSGGASNGVLLTVADQCPADTEPPITTLFGLKPGWGGAQTFRLYAKDYNSGVAAIKYSLDGLSAVDYTGPVTITQEGVHSVKYFSVDKAGITEDVRELPYSIQVDTTPPSGTMEIVNTTMDANGIDIELKLQAADSLSGMGLNSQMMFSYDGLSWMSPEPYAVSKHMSFPPGDGIKSVYAKFCDTAGNWSAVSSVSKIVDTTPPVTTFDALIPDNGFIKLNSELRLTATDAVSGVDKIYYSLTGGKPFNLLPGDCPGKSCGGTVVFTTSGQYTLAYYAVDTLGNKEAVKVAPRSFVVDASPPVVTLQINGGADETISSEVSVTVTASDEGGSGIDPVIQISNDAVHWTQMDLSSDINWTLYPGDGPRTVLVLVKDMMGLETRTRATIQAVDIAPPETTVKVPKEPGNYSLQFTVVDDMSGVSQTYYSVDGSDPSILCTGLLELPDGVYRLKYYSVDKAGNKEAIKTAPWDLKIDKSLPVLPTLTVEKEYASFGYVDLHIYNPNGIVGQTQMQLTTIKDVWYNAPEPYQLTWCWYLDYSRFAGPQTVYARFSDQQGNWGPVVTCSIIVDKDPPIVNFYINKKSEMQTRSREVLLHILVDEGEGSGPELMQFSENLVRKNYYEYTADWTPPEPYVYEKLWTLSAGSGSKNVAVRVMDKAGNWSEPKDWTIGLNIFYINNDAVYTNTQNVTLNFNLPDPSKPKSDYSIRYGFDVTGSWQPFATQATFKLFGSDGPQKVTGQIWKKGATGYAYYSDTIILDTRPPVPGTIIINSGSAAVPDPSVTLTLNASDATSGVAQMQFSDDGTVWTTPEPYAPSKAWTMKGSQGVKTVYAKFIDAAGNVSGVISGSVIIDSDLPTGSIVINSGAPFTAQNEVVLALSASDATSGMGTGARMKFSNDGAHWTETDYSAEYNWTLSAGDGVKTVYARFMDAAGNWSLPVSDTITVSRITQQITPQRVAAVSGQTVGMTFSVPYDAVSSKLFVSCPAGLTIGLGAVNNVCNRWQTLSFQPNTNRPMAFRVTNRTGQVLKAVPNFYIYKADRPNYANGVSGEITVNPN
ncbi:MAG: S8 family serine peptidase [Candidatus Omnitrophica bacterium]|nr:S8 family serine peptidase [Candidatus Omnitrophota bacterium]